jgi:hypothetical protein
MHKIMCHSPKVYSAKGESGRAARGVEGLRENPVAERISRQVLYSEALLFGLKTRRLPERGHTGLIPVSVNKISITEVTKKAANQVI